MNNYPSEKVLSGRWLVRGSGLQRPTLRLFCFSHAGGNANDYQPWRVHFDAAIEICAVQLPGRGMRMSEHPCADLALLTADLAQAITADTQIPFAFFGHSLGGLLAFETARYCQWHGLPTPRHVFASGCAAPQRRGAAHHTHDLPDGELIELLRKYNGTPPELLANAELMEIVLPIIRADFSLVENYAYVPGPALRMPISVLTGSADADVSTEQAAAWARETTARCRVHQFDGDHFFLNSHLPEVAERILADLGMRSMA